MNRFLVIIGIILTALSTIAQEDKYDLLDKIFLSQHFTIVYKDDGIYYFNKIMKYKEIMKYYYRKNNRKNLKRMGRLRVFKSDLVNINRAIVNNTGYSGNTNYKISNGVDSLEINIDHVYIWDIVYVERWGKPVWNKGFNKVGKSF